LQVVDHADAKQEPRGHQDALELAKAVHKIVVAKGKKVVTFSMKTDPPDDETLLSHLLGPTGNLPAPTLRKGKTLLVGFSEEAYKQLVQR